MNKSKMSIKDSIQYLQPIADSTPMTRYAEALTVAISAMEEIKFTRQFIHDQGLDFALMNKWEEQKKRVAETSKTIPEEIDHICEATKTVNQDHIADDGKKVHGRWIEKQEPLSWCEDDVDVFWERSACGTASCGESPYCPNCGAKMDGGDDNG